MHFDLLLLVRLTGNGRLSSMFLVSLSTPGQPASQERGNRKARKEAKKKQFVQGKKKKRKEKKRLLTLTSVRNVLIAQFRSSKVGEKNVHARISHKRLFDWYALPIICAKAKRLDLMDGLRVWSAPPVSGG